MFFLATAPTRRGGRTCSYKGGSAGLRLSARSTPRTVAFPSYDGNGMYLSAGNVLVNPDVGDAVRSTSSTGTGRRLEGTASIDPRRPPAARPTPRPSSSSGSGPAVFTRTAPGATSTATRLVRTVPLRAGTDCLTPVPEWKRSDWAFDALPEHDPARGSR